MEQNKDNILWAIKRLNELRSLHGYPADKQSLHTIARAFLRIVHNKTYREILKGAGYNYDRMVERCREEAEDSVGKEMPYILPADTNDADWLIDRILDTCDRFPMPVKMRSIHDSVFAPASRELENFPAPRLEDEY